MNKTFATMIVVAVRHKGTLTDEQAHKLVRRAIRNKLDRHQWATAVMGGPPEDGGDDVASAIYDFDTAVHFARTATGVNEDTCKDVFWSRDLFHLGLGIMQDDPEVFGTTQKELREKYPAFFRPDHIRERFVENETELAFVVMHSGVEKKIAEAVLDADLEYMRRLGLI